MIRAVHIHVLCACTTLSTHFIVIYCMRVLCMGLSLHLPSSLSPPLPLSQSHRHIPPHYRPTYQVVPRSEVSHFSLPLLFTSSLSPRPPPHVHVQVHMLCSVPSILCGCLYATHCHILPPFPLPSPSLVTPLAFSLPLSPHASLVPSPSSHMSLFYPSPSPPPSPSSLSSPSSSPTPTSSLTHHSGTKISCCPQVRDS